MLWSHRLSSQALPIFIDRLLTPVAAILLSVTAVLIVGEIIPQVACQSHSNKLLLLGSSKYSGARQRSCQTTFLQPRSISSSRVCALVQLLCMIGVAECGRRAVQHA